MRIKDEILDNARQDITSPQYGDTAHLWLEVRKIEVLIDIRDILEGVLGFLATYYEDGITPK